MIYKMALTTSLVVYTPSWNTETEKYEDLIPCVKGSRGNQTYICSCSGEDIALKTYTNFESHFTRKCHKLFRSRYGEVMRDVEIVRLNAIIVADRREMQIAQAKHEKEMAKLKRKYHALKQLRKEENMLQEVD